MDRKGVGGWIEKENVHEWKRCRWMDRKCVGGWIEKV
jgi:hypothetical protein